MSPKKLFSCALLCVSVIFSSQVLANSHAAKVSSISPVWISLADNGFKPNPIIKGLGKANGYSISALYTLHYNTKVSGSAEQKSIKFDYSYPNHNKIIPRIHYDGTTPHPDNWCGTSPTLKGQGTCNFRLYYNVYAADHDHSDRRVVDSPLVFKYTQGKDTKYATYDTEAAGHIKIDPQFLHPQKLTDNLPSQVYVGDPETPAILTVHNADTNHPMEQVSVNFTPDANHIIQLNAADPGTCATTTQLPKNGTCTIKVELHPGTQERDQIQATVDVKSYNDTYHTVLKTSAVNVEERGQVYVTGNTFTPDPLSQGDREDQTYTVSNHTPSTVHFAINAPVTLKPGSDCLSGASGAPAGGTCTFTLQYDPKTDGDIARQEIKVTAIDSPAIVYFPNRWVTIKTRALTAPTITVSPSPLAGTLDPDSQGEPFTITVQNNDTETMKGIQYNPLSSSDLVNLPLGQSCPDLAQGAKCTLHGVFKPTRLTPATGEKVTFSLQSYDGAYPASHDFPVTVTPLSGSLVISATQKFDATPLNYPGHIITATYHIDNTTKESVTATVMPPVNVGYDHRCDAPIAPGGPGCDFTLTYDVSHGKLDAAKLAVSNNRAVKMEYPDGADTINVAPRALTAPTITVSPSPLVAAVNPDSQGEPFTITVLNNDTETMKGIQYKPLSGSDLVNLPSGQTCPDLAHGAKCTLHGVFKPTQLTPPSGEQVSFSLSSYQGAYPASYQFPVTVTPLAGSLVVSATQKFDPTPLDNPGNIIKAIYHIDNGTKEPLKVTIIPPANVTHESGCEGEIAPGALGCDFTLSYDASQGDLNAAKLSISNQRGADVKYTDDADKITVAPRKLAKPTITVTPLTATVGDNKQPITVTITNNDSEAMKHIATEPLTGSDLVTLDDGQTCPTELPHGGVCTLTGQFNPYRVTKAGEAVTFSMSSYGGAYPVSEDFPVTVNKVAGKVVIERLLKFPDTPLAHKGNHIEASYHIINETNKTLNFTYTPPAGSGIVVNGCETVSPGTGPTDGCDLRLTYEVNNVTKIDGILGVDNDGKATINFSDNDITIHPRSPSDWVKPTVTVTPNHFDAKKGGPDQKFTITVKNNDVATLDALTAKAAQDPVSEMLKIPSGCAVIEPQGTCTIEGVFHPSQVANDTARILFSAFNDLNYADAVTTNVSVHVEDNKTWQGQYLLTDACVKADGSDCFKPNTTAMTKANGGLVIGTVPKTTDLKKVNKLYQTINIGSEKQPELAWQATKTSAALKRINKLVTMSNGDVLAATEGQGVMRSRQAGSWDSYPGKDSAIADKAVRDIVINDSDNVVVTTFDYLGKSTLYHLSDEKSGWQSITGSPLDNSTVSGLLLKGSNLYGLSIGGDTQGNVGVFSAINYQASSWTKHEINDDVEQHLSKIALTQDGTGIDVGTTDGQIFHADFPKTGDWTWAQIAQLQPDLKPILPILTILDQGQHQFVGTDNHAAGNLWYHNKSDANWTAIPLLPDNSDQSVEPSVKQLTAEEHDAIAIATTAGVYQTNIATGKNTISPVLLGKRLNSSEITKLVEDNSNNLMYALTADEGVYQHSIDAKTTLWSLVGDYAMSKKMSAIAVRNGQLYAMSTPSAESDQIAKLYRWDGSAWQIQSSGSGLPESQAANSLISVNNLLYAGLADGQIYNAETGQVINSQGCLVQSMSRDGNGGLYALCKKDEKWRVFYYTDAVTFLDNPPATLTGVSINSMFASNDGVYLATDDGVYKHGEGPWEKLPMSGESLTHVKQVAKVVSDNAFADDGLYAIAENKTKTGFSLYRYDGAQWQADVQRDLPSTLTSMLPLLNDAGFLMGTNDGKIYTLENV